MKKKKQVIAYIVQTLKDKLYETRCIQQQCMLYKYSLTAMSKFIFSCYLFTSRIDNETRFFASSRTRFTSIVCLSSCLHFLSEWRQTNQFIGIASFNLRNVSFTLLFLRTKLQLFIFACICPFVEQFLDVNYERRKLKTNNFHLVEINEVSSRQLTFVIMNHSFWLLRWSTVTPHRHRMHRPQYFQT